MTIQNRISEIINTYGQSVKAFSKEVNIPYTSLRSALDKENDSISTKYCSNILKKYENINANWLLTGEGEMFISSEVSAPQKAPAGNEEVQELKTKVETLTKESGKLEYIIEQMKKEQAAAQKNSNLKLKFNNKPKVRTPQSIAKDKIEPGLNVESIKEVTGEIEQVGRLYEGRLSCGYGGIVEDQYEEIDLKNFIIGNRDIAHIIQLTGDSMVYSGIYDGDYAVVDLNKKEGFRPNELVVAEVYIDQNKEYVCKRYLSNGREKVLRSDNYHYPDIIVNESVKIIGSVISILRQIKR